MRTTILPLALLAIAISSCSVAYRTGQTPDDVYYSPAHADHVAVNTNSNNDQNNYEDNAMLMSIRDPRWRDLDYDYYNYNYSPYLYGYNYDYYYNPYYYPYPVYALPFTIVNTTPRMTNLSAYKSGYNNSNTSTLYRPVVRQPENNSSGNGSGSGFVNTIRQIFSAPASYNNDNTPANTNSNNNINNNNASDRNYTPSSSNSSSPSSSGGISRPARTGR